MDKDDVKNYLSTASHNNTLLTPKHNPADLSTTYDSYRTVLSQDLSQNLDAFIESGEYIVREYYNNLYPNSPHYIEIEPYPGSTFSVPASGVAPNAPFASSALDRIVAVSGTNQGWHIFGEDSSEIALKVSRGDLTFIEEAP